MTGEQFFEKFPFEYHDGTVSDVRASGNDLVLSVTRCPISLRSEEDKNSLFQRLKFKNVTDIWLIDDEKKRISTLTWEEMWKSVTLTDVVNILNDDGDYWMNDALMDNGMFIFDFLLRFRFDDIEILETRTNPEYFAQEP